MIDKKVLEQALKVVPERLHREFVLFVEHGELAPDLKRLIRTDRRVCNAIEDVFRSDDDMRDWVIRNLL